VLVEAGERSGTVHQVHESLRARHPVLVPERLLDAVSWLRSLQVEPLLRPWRDAQELNEVIRSREQPAQPALSGSPRW
jgi:hypothetical protein